MGTNDNSQTLDQILWSAKMGIHFHFSVAISGEKQKCEMEYEHSVSTVH